MRAGVVRERPGPVEAVTLGLSGFKDVVVGTFTGFWWLLSGKISATGPDGAVGPVGIINVSRQAVQQSWYPILLAFLSFNLGLINLLPILPFDGGHIAMNMRRAGARPAAQRRACSSAWSPSAPCCS